MWTRRPGGVANGTRGDRKPGFYGFSVLLLFALTILIPANLRADPPSLIVPPGQENPIQSVLTPLGQNLSEGLELAHIRVEQDRIYTIFQKSGEEDYVLYLSPSDQESPIHAGVCHEISPLKLCDPNGRSSPEWVSAFVRRIRDSHSEEVLTAFWTSGRLSPDEWMNFRFDSPPLAFLAPFLFFWAVLGLLIQMPFRSKRSQWIFLSLWLLGALYILFWGVSNLHTLDAPEVFWVLLGLSALVLGGTYVPRGPNDQPDPLLLTIERVTLLLLGIFLSTMGSENLAPHWVWILVLLSTAVFLLGRDLATNRTRDLPLWGVIRLALLFLLAVRLFVSVVLAFELEPDPVGVFWTVLALLLLWFFLTAKIWMKEVRTLPNIEKISLFSWILLAWILFVLGAALDSLISKLVWNLPVQLDASRVHAHLTQVFIGGIFALTAVTASVAAIREKTTLKGFMIGMSGVFVFAWVGFPLILRPDIVPLNTLWVLLERGAMLSQGIMPGTGRHFLGEPFIASVFFQTFGLTPLAVNLLQYVAVMGVGGAVALCSWIIFRSYLSVVVSLTLLALWPSLPILMRDSWWFLYGATFKLLALAALIHSARDRKPTYFLAGLLLIQVAILVRIGTYGLIPTLVLIEIGYGLPNRRNYGLLLLFVAVNLGALLMHVLSKNETIVNSDLIQFAQAYMESFQGMAGYFIAGAIGLFLLFRRQPVPALALLTLFLWTWLLYLSVRTIPTQSESFMILLPILLLAGGVAKGWNEGALRRRALRFGFAVLLLFLVMNDPSHERAYNQERFDQNLRLAERFQALLASMPADSTILLHPIHRLMVQPDEREADRLNEILRKGNYELTRTIHEEENLICLDTQERNMCCNVEISGLGPSGLDRSNTSGDCWPPEIFGLTGVPFTGDRQLRLLKLLPIDRITRKPCPACAKPSN